MIDIFSDYNLQREELLARIAQELDLDKSRIERMESAYHAVQDVLKKNDPFFEDVEIELYAQGSKRIGTTVKPINGNDFDLDTVMHVYSEYTNYIPTQVYNALVNALEQDLTYKSIMEKKDRCVRLDYKGDFHMDILPACMVEIFDREKVAIPERRLSDWSFGNPRGFANWFMSISNTGENILLKSLQENLLNANVESEALPNDDTYTKSPLQRAVQLVKRYRDMYFTNRDYPVSSIVITTLMGLYYEGEDTIFSSINNCLEKIKNEYNKTILDETKFKVLNPVNSKEDFTDNWTIAHYHSFYLFIEDFYSKWQLLMEDFQLSGNEYINLFGEGVYKKSLQDQASSLSKFSSNQRVNTTAAILTNKAMTEKSGRINTEKGVKNEPHSNFGG